MCDNSSFIFIYPSIFFSSSPLSFFSSVAFGETMAFMKPIKKEPEIEKSTTSEEENRENDHITAINCISYWNALLFLVFILYQYVATDPRQPVTAIGDICFHAVWMRRAEMIHIIQRYQSRIIPLSLASRHISLKRNADTSLGCGTSFTFANYNRHVQDQAPNVRYADPQRFCFRLIRIIWMHAATVAVNALFEHDRKPVPNIKFRN